MTVNLGSVLVNRVTHSRFWAASDLAPGLVPLQLLAHAILVADGPHSLLGDVEELLLQLMSSFL